jgi:hypothetical protein
VAQRFATASDGMAGTRDTQWMTTRSRMLCQCLCISAEASIACACVEFACPIIIR